MKHTIGIRGILAAAILAGAGALLAGCPTLPPIDGGGNGQVEYDLGLAAGFLRDDWYFQGFDDSYDTVDGGPIYYQGSEIPYLDELSYDAGFYDGVWIAYNDGYFVSYDYAFTIGFSEGYSLFYSPNWPTLLASDQHVEWLDGGFTDGYNDGFSEGRIFGAYDYETNFANDWLDAELDYRAGTDVVVAGVSTGNDGPVFLYEYGIDPLDLIETKSASGNVVRSAPRASIRSLEPAAAKAAVSLRGAAPKQDELGSMYRTLPQEYRSRFNQKPANSPRVGGTIPLDSTWLQRIDALNAAIGSGAKSAVGSARTGGVVVLDE